MGNVMVFNEVLESADKLSLDEQETLMEVLHRRIIEHRRAELVKEIRDTQQEYQKVRCVPATPSELMKDILS